MQEILRETAFRSLTDCWDRNRLLPNFNRTEFVRITEYQLKMLNSHRLKKAIKTRAHPFVMERVVEVILRRLADPIHNPPLKIAVFGGSVSCGRKSRRNKFGVGYRNRTLHSKSEAA